MPIILLLVFIGIIIVDEVVNNDVEIQSSKYETSQTIESQRATGLLQ